MSDVCFERLGIPAPQLHFNDGNGAQGQPDAVVMVCNANSTLACANGLTG